MKEDEEFQFSKFKQRLLDFTKQLVSNDMSTNFYLSLILIENLQFLAYYCNGLLSFNAIGFPYFQAIGKYVNLIYFLQQSNINFYLVPLFTIISLIHLIMVIIGYRTYQLKMENARLSIKTQNFQKNRLQYFINLFMIFYNTVLTIPIFQTSITAIYCTSINPFTNIQQCYQGSHIIIMILAIFNMAWLLTTNIYYTLYYFIRNPFSANFLTCSSNWWSLGKFAIKITPMIYIMYDPLIQYPTLFLIIMAASYGGYLGIFRIIFPYYRYNFGLQKILFSIEAFTCLFNLFFVIIHFFGNNITGSPNALFIGWTFFSFLTTSVIKNIFVRLKKGLIKDIHSLDKNKTLQIQQYLLYLIDETETNYKTKDHRSFLISNIAKTHQQLCKDVECYCHEFVSQAKKLNYNTNKSLFYMLLLAIIDRLISQNKKAYSFFILKAYILFYKMSSQIKAATTISKIMSDKLDFSDQMLVKGLLFQLDEQYTDTSDMEIYRKFNQFLLLQEEESLKIVNLYLQYWQELIDQKSSLIKLNTIIKKIKASKTELNRIVEGSLGIYHNHVRVLMLYKNFLKEVLNDYSGYLKYEQKYKMGVKQSKLTNVDAFNTIQFRANENLIVINSTRKDNHSQNLGSYQIVTVSSNVKQLLGYTNTQLRAQSLNKLIPSIYHEVHDEYINKILNMHDSEIKSRTIRIFPTDSAGHIIECNVISKFMPSIENGISIISFIEQCEKFKDQFFVIYNSNTGIVDCMSSGAEALLKENALKRKTNDMLVIPDHINDLLPNWDFQRQKWRNTQINTNSLVKLNQCDIRQTQIVRSDGINKKYIKVLKFKADYFLKTYTLSNQNFNESKTVKQYLSFRHESDKQNLYRTDSKKNQGLGQNQKKIQTSRKISKKPLKQSNSKKDYKAIHIEEKPSQLSRIAFAAMQWILFISALSLTFYQFILTNSNISTYNQDASLMNTLNTIRTIITDSAYINSLVATQEAYAFTNMTLPYKSYVSVITMPPQLDELSQMMANITSLMNEVNPILIESISNGELSKDSVMVTVRYLLKKGTKIYYNETMTVMQAISQFIVYCEEIIYKLKVSNESIQNIISSPSFFYIFANNLDIIPDILIKLFNNILLSIGDKLNHGFIIFVIVKAIVAALIITSGMLTFIYYRIVYNNYLMKVLNFYQLIRVEHIKLYEEKCQKYKESLDLIEENLVRANSSPNSSAVMYQVKQGKINDETPSVMELKQEQEKMLMVQVMQPNINMEEDHFLNFESIPSLKGITFKVIIWGIVYAFILFFLCYKYNSTTVYLNDQINKLNKYTLMVNSVIQFRLYSQLSLNMLGYWDDLYLSIIKSELQINFDNVLTLSNDTSLNFTGIKPLLASKYQQFRSIQSDVLANNHTRLNQLASSIESQLEQMDVVLQFLQNQCPYYLNVVLSESQTMGNNFTIYIATSLLFILVFWIVATNYNYQKLMDEHKLAFEMYQIIGYNLKKQIENNGLELHIS